MADTTNGDDFSAIITELERGGVNIQNIADVAKNIHAFLLKLIDGVTLGDDQISQLIQQQYKPGEQAGLDFLNGLSDLMDMHGGKTSDLAKIFDNMNTAAVDEVNSVPVDNTTVEHGPSPGIKAH